MTLVTGTLAIGGGSHPTKRSWVEVRVVKSVFLTADTLLLAEMEPAYTNDAGEWSVNCAVLPEGYAYRFTAVIGGAIRETRTVIVPDVGSIAYGALVDASGPTNPGFAEPAWVEVLHTNGTAAVAAAQLAKTGAEQAKADAIAAAAGATVDSAIAGRVNDSTSATRAALSSTYETPAGATAKAAAAALPKLDKTVAATSYAAYPNKGGLGKMYGGLALSRTRAVPVAFAGSSTTYGNSASVPAKRYVDLLIAAIQSAYPSGTGTEATVVASMTADWGTIDTSAGIHGYNAGEPSTVAANYLTDAECDKIAALNPVAMFHMVGSNDRATNVVPSVYKATMVSRLAYLKSKITGPCVHILIQPYERYDVGGTYPWADYGKALQEIADADPDNMAFFDISAPYYLIGIPSTDPLGLMSSDHIHQVDAGHALMADLIRRAIGIPAAPAVTATPTTAPTVTRITSDDFSGADTTTPQSRATDVVYGGTAATPSVSVAGVFSIVSEQLRVTGTSFLAYPVTAQDVQITARYVGAAAGVTTTQSVILASRRNTLSGATMQMKVCVDGAKWMQMEVNSPALSGRRGPKIPVAPGDVFGIRSVGSVHSLLLNGAIVYQETISGITGSTLAGVIGSAANVHIVDQLVISSLP